ncbi:MAG TPA: membrane-associated protein [Methylomirabilota bacterium]|nr:membrane-associated protein [Methylomirabilota bacterium]
MEPHLPLSIKLLATAFVTALVPVYARHYGWANFLWFSDIALFVSVAALWLESPLLASMMTVAVGALECAWMVDFAWRVVLGRGLLGLTNYMFDARNPRFIRGLSLFHVVMPVLLLWMVARLGYDRRAFVLQTLLTWVVLLVTYCCTRPEDNINWAFGLGSKPQQRVPPLVHLVFLMLALPAVVYWPTHLALRYLFS